MGFFGGGGNSGAQDTASQQITQQFKQNQADIEAKKKALYEERINIIKSQGGQNWHPKR